MKNKPTVEQALLFKRLSTQDWYGVRDHVIKECLVNTNWNEKEAKKFLDEHFIPPPPDHWCPRWSFNHEPMKESDGVRWYLVSRMEIKGEGIAIPLDRNLKPTNVSGHKMSEYHVLHEDGSYGEAEYMEKRTNGTEGHPYETFTEAFSILKANPDKADSVFVQCPDGTRIKYIQPELSEMHSSM